MARYATLHARAVRVGGWGVNRDRWGELYLGVGSLGSVDPGEGYSVHGLCGAGCQDTHYQHSRP